MKKIMMIAAMVMATVSANAQFEPGTFSLQPKLGVTASWLSNMPKLTVGTANTTLDKVPAVGALIGAEAEYQLTNMFSIAAGVGYSMQGSGWEDYTESAGGVKAELKDAKVELGYINVPVVANVYLFKGFAVKTGVQFGFLTSAKEKGSMKIKSDTQTVNIELEDDNSDFKDACKKFDVSIPVGVSYQFKAPVTLDLRYNIGLTKVNKESADKDLKNNVVQLTVGYKFAL
jgi:opacity protein-like surface antigen